MTVIYKIQHRKTGLYSRGSMTISADGTTYGWSKNGKIWDTIGKLRSHITAHIPSAYRRGTDMSDWQVVTYKLEVDSVNYVHEIVTPDKIVSLLTKFDN